MYVILKVFFFIDKTRMDSSNINSLVIVVSELGNTLLKKDSYLPLGFWMYVPFHMHSFFSSPYE